MRRPRFYCEFCGAEVRKDARICHKCGRFFSSVKCPKCGHVGKADDFSFGCPTCGYSVKANPPPEDFKSAPVVAPPLPWWTFVAAAFAILVLSLILIQSLR